ncbi:MAG: YibE/F family protein [Patescibacteria group bacterium]|nr:YibE/F family protein [Patescibacteria group bacterium]MDD4304378.1 YibE/F family protein [Patescibacteria group bacterium]MDD4695401.1 YibE/F family protein [Patescibacteria group bacterium]
MKIKLLLFFILFPAFLFSLFLDINFVNAQENSIDNSNEEMILEENMPQEINLQNKGKEEIFKARVVEVVENKNTPRDDGSISIQQKLKLIGLEDNWKDKEIVFDGTVYDVSSASEYKVGEKVLVHYSAEPDGAENFYVIGFSRTNSIYWLVLLFILTVVIIGKFKGVRALVVLLLTFLVILKFIIPKILSGADPLFITILGSLFILIFGVYITEGLKKTSTISIFSILISLVITGLLSIWFSSITKLTGFASEEATYLVGLGDGNINIKGLLLAGIIIGALGVLDDVIISQVALVKELKISNPELSKNQIYKQAMRVGVSHLSSMVNTLFLAYAGASLPLLILFSIKQEPFLTFNQVIDNEMMATEIVRALTGSIGLVLAVPIATILAVNFISQERLRKQ